MEINILQKIFFKKGTREEYKLKNNYKLRDYIKKMRISILLPFKENFSPEYPGAVSLFINDTLKVSKYKKVQKYLEIQILKNLIITTQILN